MNPVLTARLRIALFLVVAIVIQTALGTDMRVAGVAPDLMVIGVICAGLTGGAESGAWVGFWAGLLTDMFLTSTPVGLSALTYCLVGAAVGALRASVLQERKLLVPITALVGTAGAVLLFVAAGDVLGQTQLMGGGRSWLIRVMVVESLWSAVLSLPFGYIYAWAARGSVGADRLGAPIGPSSRTGVVPTK
ncbi:MAG TPA: rod shape-determining protein MreD [Acidimicrobiales bacterium]|nr:rod shape-determining protein MreD [Acidimicrobiales bacterium]